MAAGDVYLSFNASVATAGTVSFQPAASSEIVLHNVCCSYNGAQVAYQLYASNGTATDDILIDSATTLGMGAMMFNALHCNNTYYYKIKNVSGANANIWADGIFTKSAT